MRLQLGMIALATFATFSMAPSTALAACKSMNAESFAKFAADAEVAIDDDDLVRHGQIYRALQEQLPCMDERLPIDGWADFLVGYAIVEYAMGREWEDALGVAVTIKPTVARDFGPAEIRNFVPTATFDDDSKPPLPVDAEIYLDGQRIQYEPAVGSLHIVQQFKNGVWNTRLLQNEPFPEDWRVQFVDEPELASETTDRLGIHASVYGVGGYALAGQSVTQGASDNNIDDVEANSALFGIGSHGAYFPSEIAGMFWDISAPFSIAQGMGVEGFVGPAIAIGDLHIKPGIGAVSVVVSDVNLAHAVVLPQSHLYADYGLPVGDTLSLEVGAGGGYWISGWHAKARAGVRGGGDVGWNAGLEFSGVTGFFAEPSSQRLASVSTWRVGLRGGVSFGKR